MGREDELRDFYAESARRWEVAKREFQQRTQGWHFELAPEADQWAESHASGERWSFGSFATVRPFSDPPGSPRP